MSNAIFIQLDELKTHVKFWSYKQMNCDTPVHQTLTPHHPLYFCHGCHQQQRLLCKGCTCPTATKYAAFHAYKKLYDELDIENFTPETTYNLDDLETQQTNHQIRRKVYRTVGDKKVWGNGFPEVVGDLLSEYGYHRSPAYASSERYPMYTRRYGN